MTNEEKSRETAKEIANPTITLENRNSVEFSLEGKCEQAALEMAKWKDKQFKEYLEKKKRDISLRRDWSAYENTIYNDCLAEIINDLFKED